MEDNKKEAVELTEQEVDDIIEDANNIKDEGDSLKLENMMYVIYELEESLTEAIKNVTSLTKDNERLVELVTADEDDAKRFKGFADGIETQNVEYKKQIERLKHKRKSVQVLLAMYEDRSTEEQIQFARVIETTVTYLLTATGK